MKLYIDRAIADALEALASRPGGNKSRLVNDAHADWLKRKGSADVDELLKIRLDRMSRDIARVLRGREMLLESLALFVHYQLAVTAPLSEADAAALAAGRERFEQFTAQVGRRIAAGKRSLGDPDNRRQEP